MRDHYNNYCQTLSAKCEYPYVPSEARLAFLISEDTPIRSNAWTLEDELVKIYDLQKDNDLCPSVSYLDIGLMIGGYLLPKYQALCIKTLKPSKLHNVSEEDKAEIIKFLSDHGDEIGCIADSRIMLTAFRLVGLLPEEAFPTFDNFPMMSFKSFPCVKHCGGVFQGKMTIKFEDYTRGIYTQIMQMHQMQVQYMHPPHGQQNAAAQERSLAQKVERALSSLAIFFKNWPNFDINTDCADIDKQIPKWFNITRQLAIFELNYWNHRAPLMEQLINDLNLAKAALENENNGRFYSGLSTSSFSVSLTRTTEQNAVDRATLLSFVEEEIKDRDKDIQEYARAKPILSVLKKTGAWLDYIFDCIDKKGNFY
jgi:hypothetical protein